MSAIDDFFEQLDEYRSNPAAYEAIAALHDAHEELLEASWQLLNRTALAVRGRPEGLDVARARGADALRSWSDALKHADELIGAL